MTFFGLCRPAPLYRIEGQNGSLNFGFLASRADGNFRALLAVDLHRQGHRCFRPADRARAGARLRQPASDGRAPPSIPRPDAASSARKAEPGCRPLAQGPGKSARRGFGRADGVGQRIGEFVMWATQRLKRNRRCRRRHCPSARWAALRTVSASSAERCAGGFAARRSSAISPTSRHSRCTKRQAPCTPSSVQITSRSGGCRTA